MGEMLKLSFKKSKGKRMKIYILLMIAMSCLLADTVVNGRLLVKNKQWEEFNKTYNWEMNIERQRQKILEEQKPKIIVAFDSVYKQYKQINNQDKITIFVIIILSGYVIWILKRKEK